MTQLLGSVQADPVIQFTEIGGPPLKIFPRGRVVWSLMSLTWVYIFTTALARLKLWGGGGGGSYLEGTNDTNRGLCKSHNAYGILYAIQRRCQNIPNKRTNVLFAEGIVTGTVSARDCVDSIVWCGENSCAQFNVIFLILVLLDTLLALNMYTMFG
jgi:hypothetical protein